MKKMVIAGLIMVFLSGGISKVQAFEESGQVNALDLRNLVVDDGMAMTRNEISVEPDTTYTLVLSSDFLGDHYGFITTMDLVTIDEEGVFEWRFLKDFTQSNGYVEFETHGDTIHLQDLPLDPRNGHRAMLFKGHYESFDGYKPFVFETLLFHDEETIVIPYETDLSLSDIDRLVGAYGPNQEEIDHITKEDDYTTGNKRPGTYVIRFESTYHDVVSTFDLFIRVVDDKAPEIIHDGEYVFDYTGRPTLSEIMGLLTIEDNVDQLGPEDLSVVSDTYQDASAPGTYEIVLKTSDSSGNETIEEIEVTLLDSMGPIVDGTDIIFIYTEDEPLSNEDILSHYDVYDAVDGDDVHYGIDYDTYQRTRIPGVYEVSIRAIDSDGNQTTRYIEIHVIGNSPVRFEIGDLDLVTTTREILGEDDLVAFMNDTLQNLGYDASNIKITYDDYSARSDEEGTYYVYFDYEIDEKSYQSRLSVSVEDEKPDVIVYALMGTLILGAVGFFVIRRRR